MKLRVAQGIIFGVTLGLALGVGTYTFVYARGYSYMTDTRHQIPQEARTSRLAMPICS